MYRLLALTIDACHQFPVKINKREIDKKGVLSICAYTQSVIYLCLLGTTVSRLVLFGHVVDSLIKSEKTENKGKFQIFPIRNMFSILTVLRLKSFTSSLALTLATPW